MMANATNQQIVASAGGFVLTQALIPKLYSKKTTLTKGLHSLCNRLMMIVYIVGFAMMCSSGLSVFTNLHLQPTQLSEWARIAVSLGAKAVVPLALLLCTVERFAGVKETALGNFRALLVFVYSAYTLSCPGVTTYLHSFMLYVYAVGVLDCLATEFSDDEKSPSPASTAVESARVGLHCTVFTSLVALLYYDEGVFASRERFWTVQISAMMFYLVALFDGAKFIRNRMPKLRPTMSTTLPIFHVFACVGLYLCFRAENGLRLFLEALLLYVITGFGITCGAHRLWAHRSYKACAAYRCFLMILNSIACQGDILHWSTDHRVHHKFSEAPPDPHNAALGFFHSHCGWLLFKREPEVIAELKKTDVSDLKEDFFVWIQNYCDPFWNLSFCFILPGIYGHYVHNNFWLGFFVHGCLRWVMCLHATWCVNSVAHLYGARPYSPDIGPAESLFTAVFADGEGWHNWHHTYGFDYATSEHGALVQWNPSKVVIDVCANLGLVWDRRRATGLWEKTKAAREAHLRNLAEQKLAAQQVNAVSEGDKKEEIKKEEESLSNVPSIDDYSGFIPVHCHKASAVRSSVNFCRDVVLSVAMFLVAFYSQQKWVSVYGESSIIGQVVIWTIHSLAQGTIWCSFWVVGYECSGGRFSSTSFINHAVGVALHSLLLVPYKPRRRHREFEAAGANVRQSVKGDILAVLQPWNFFWWPLCPFVAFPFIVLLYKCYMAFGMYKMLCWYFGPYIVFNMWLIAYVPILSKNPYDQEKAITAVAEERLAIATHDWLKKNLQYLHSFSLRSPIMWIADHTHHHLRHLNVLQAVDFSVPHYHAREALREVAKVVNEKRKTLERTIGASMEESMRTKKVAAAGFTNRGASALPTSLYG